MNDKIEVRVSQSFKDDLQTHAKKRNQSMSEYLREAARRQMQRDIQNND